MSHHNQMHGDGHTEHHGHSEHHAMMAADFKRRFFIALVVSIPILTLSPSIQNWFGFTIPPFYGEQYVMFGLASIVALYCSWPFYTHGFDELKEKQLGMMVLVSLAVLSGYLYSVATTFFIIAPYYYREIAALATILLLGRWLEMRAVGGTSGALIPLVKSAQESKPRSQRLADRAAHWLTIIAITVGVGTFLVWNVWLGATFVFALTLAITVVVITCPHALGLAIPAVTTITSTLAAKHGILIKNMDGLDAARSIGWVLFDKTGTLTHGTFGVSDIAVFSGEKDALLQYAASVESHFEHTIGRSIAEHAKEQGIALLKVKGFKAIAGQGVFARVQDTNGEAAEVVVGTTKLLQDYGIELGREHVQTVSVLERKGATVVYVASRKKLIGVIALSDTVKDESKQAVRELEAMGMAVAMITGDNEAVAKHVAQELGIEKYFSRVLPEDKVKKVRELQSGGKKVMMVGDGINDAPALTQSDVGVAIGAGTDVAAASSEIILVKNNPLDIVKLIKLSRATSTKMKQNLGWAVGYNVIAIPLAAGVFGSWGIFLRPEWGAIAMTLSSVIVVINALLLKRLALAP
ncbi:MAG: heavy metal translocating P-type ATPase [bacterium]|nr:heavy metal translocating P-type ATPase [bacterium]